MNAGVKAELKTSKLIVKDCIVSFSKTMPVIPTDISNKSTITLIYFIVLNLCNLPDIYAMIIAAKIVIALVISGKKTTQSP